MGPTTPQEMAFSCGKHADACAARACGGTGGEDGDDGAHHLALELLDHLENGDCGSSMSRLTPPMRFME